MPVRRNLHTLKLIRTDPTEFDSQTPAVCPDAEEFAKWTESLVAQSLAEPTHEQLDSALLRLTKEYLHRKSRINHPHLGYNCFPGVFEKAASTLFGKQMELIRGNEFRHPPPAPEKPLEEHPQVLYIGEYTESSD
jgi:hypothetical protein